MRVRATEDIRLPPSVGRALQGGGGRRVRLRQYWLTLPLAGMTHRQLASLRHGPRLYVLVVGDEGTVSREIEDRRTPSGLDSHPACMCPGAGGARSDGEGGRTTLSGHNRHPLC